MGSGYGHNWTIYLVLWVTTWVIADDPKPNFKEHLNEVVPKDRSCNFLLTPQDARLRTPQVLDRYGYSNEIHSVTTDDGFILEIHRIPSPGRPVVLLVHGVSSSSRDFVINCERRALAFMLADEGYDVWMSNYRGNSYTTHNNMTKNDPKFWDYSIDEWALLDTPTTIDYILNETGQSQLSYVGMSMGNAIALLMLSAKPQYNQKVNIWFAMGAAFDLRKTKSLVFRGLSRFRRPFGRMMKMLNRGAIIPFLFHPWMQVNIPKFCSSDSQLKNPNSICSNVGFLLDGYDPGQVSPVLKGKTEMNHCVMGDDCLVQRGGAASYVTEFLKTLKFEDELQFLLTPKLVAEVLAVNLGGYPEQNSIKSFVQWFQWIRKGHYAKYDYGLWNNLIHYGTLNAPLYPLDKITTSVVFFGTNGNDYITTQGTAKESIELAAIISSHANFSIVPVNSSTWNHFDFLNGKDADILVYRHILKRLGEIYPK